MEESLIEIEIENIFKSIDLIKKYCKNRPQAYSIKYRIELYLFNNVSKQAKSCQMPVWATLIKKLSERPFKNCPIWSHCIVCNKKSFAELVPGRHHNGKTVSN